ncbi:radical SAM family heme chaperone HemW [bacterium]|nr:radical SAM family heme chaperone HemW [bacterium]
MPQSAYIHIPFCRSKCKYCSFVSFNKPEPITAYMYSIMKEISENYSGEELKTLYFGGGTPSIIPIDLIQKVIKKFRLAKNAEITFELNPDDSNPDYLTGLLNMGVNRLSIGSQTFDDNILKLIGRRHNSNQIINAVYEAKQAGFENISVDLIYGLPTQTLIGVKKDLDKVLNLDIQHVSTYGLKIEKEAFFGKNPPENLPDEDEQADMYEFINNILESKGFLRYEISNFAQSGFESKHNLNYWNNNEYYGFGTAAHGYNNGIRYYNHGTIEKYIEKPSSHAFGKLLTEKEKLEEEIFLGFRKTSGIDVLRINNRFNIDFETKYSDVLEKYSDFFEKTPNGYKLNIKGIMVSNIILAEFLEE